MLCVNIYYVNIIYIYIYLLDLFKVKINAKRTDSVNELGSRKTVWEAVSRMNRSGQNWGRRPG